MYFCYIVNHLIITPMKKSLFTLASILTSLFGAHLVNASQYTDIPSLFVFFGSVLILSGIYASIDIAHDNQF